MSLTGDQFARAAALEASQARVHHLMNMSAAELRALLQRSPAQAAPWIASAAEYGVPAAQLCLGRMQLSGEGVVVDPASAVRWFRRAAEQGDAEALNMLGRCLEHGWGVTMDLAAAAEQYRLAAQAGHDWGEYNLGNLLFDGRGVPQDQPQAFRWYLKAAQRGHGRAMNLVGRCLEQGWGCVANRDEAAHWYQAAAQTGYFRGQFNHALILLELRQYESAADWMWKCALGADSALRRAIVQLLERSGAAVLRDLSRSRRGAAARGAAVGRSTPIRSSR